MLGYLALAIEHAGAYIHSVGETLPNYRHQLQDNRRKMLEKRPGVSMHKESVFEKFNIAFDTLKERSMAAVRMLCFFGFLNGDLISENSLLLTDEGIAEFAVEIVKDRQKYHDAIEELLSFSLIRISVDEDKKSISLHLLVHYLCRARLNLENQWLWRESVVKWLLRSLSAIGADPSLFPHLQGVLQQLQVPGDLPTNLERRRRTYNLLGILLYHYVFAWHTLGAMTELHTCSVMIQDVLEETEDQEWLSFAAGFLINIVRQNTVSYVSSDETQGQVLRRYLFNRMTSSAALALQHVSEEEGNRKSTTQSRMTRLIDTNIANNDPFDETILTAALFQKISLPSTTHQTPAQPGGSQVELSPHPIKDKGTEASTEDVPRSNATPQAVKTTNDFDKRNSFLESCLPESEFAAYLVASLKGLSILYHKDQRNAEADLLLTYSNLPLEVPTEPQTHFKITAQNLLVQHCS